MKPFTVVTPHSPRPFFEKTLFSLLKSALVEYIVVVSQEPVHFNMDKCHLLVTKPLPSHKTLRLVLDGIRTKYLLLLPEAQQISIEPKILERFLEVAESTKAGLVYSDFYDQSEHKKTLHPLNDYQLGSVRDDFDFGAIILFSVPAIRKTLGKYGIIPKVEFAGLYDLRLKVSIDHSIYHFKEPLYTVTKTDAPSNNEKLFAYVDPQNQPAQK